MSGTMFNPKFMGLEDTPQTKPKAPKDFPVLKTLVWLLAISAVLAGIGFYGAFDLQEQHKEALKAQKERRMEFHQLHQKKSKSEAEWARFCQLAQEFARKEYAACEAAQWLDNNSTLRIMAKGNAFWLDFQSLRHILDCHTERYPNSKCNEHGRTTFPKSTSIGQINSLLVKAEAIINQSGYDFATSESWKGWQKEVFYLYIDGLPYVLAVKGNRISSFYPCRDSEVNKHLKDFINEND